VSSEERKKDRRECREIWAFTLFLPALTPKATLISSLRDEEGEAGGISQSAIGELNQPPCQQQGFGGNEAEGKARTPTS
jgi:hypothetical protein